MIAGGSTESEEARHLISIMVGADNDLHESDLHISGPAAPHSDL